MRQNLGMGAGTTPAMSAWRRAYRLALTPQALADRTVAQFGAAVLLVGVAAAILTVDLLNPGRDTVGALTFLPVLTAGWLLSTSTAATVATVAVAFRVVAITVGAESVTTGVAQTIVIVAGALVSGMAARFARGWSQAALLEQQLHEQQGAQLRVARAQEMAVRAQLEVARHIQTSPDVAGLLASLTATVAELVEARRVVFFRLDAEGRLTALPSAFGVDPATLEQLRDLVVDAADPAAPVLSAGQALRWSAADGSPCSVLVVPGATDCLVVPWRAGDRRLGALGAYDGLRPGGFTEEDTWVLRSAALAAGLVWQLREAEAEEQRRVEELTLMREAAQSLASATDVEAVMREVVTIAATMAASPGAPPRHAALLSIDGDRVRSVVEYDQPDGLRRPGTVFDIAANDGLRQVHATGLPWTGGLDPESLAEPAAGLVRRAGTLSAVICAVRSGGAVDGMLAVSARDPQGFTPVHVERLTALANLAGLALGNAEHLDLVRRDALRTASLERAKSDFLRLASHELRGPLAVVGGYVDMLAAGTFGPVDQADVRRPLPVLQDKVGEMNELIDQMLEMARLEDERLELQLELVDLRDVLSAALRTAEPLVTAKHTLVLEAGEQPATVRGDSRRLVRIVANLLSNALKYSPGGGEVRVTCRVDAAEGVVRVAVADQGMGIEEDQLDRLFTMFGRVVTAENSHIPGTGLGLYLSQRLAAMHGGSITVASRPGAGSTFTLSLPLAEAGSAGGAAGERLAALPDTAS
jgi:signal transduction histidine kinase